MTATTTPTPTTAPRPRNRLRAALLAVPLTAGLLSGILATPAHADARAEAPASHQSSPDSLTCKGKGIDPDAELHHGTEIFIEAPLREVWKLHTDVEGWPAWQEPVTSMRKLDPGPLRTGSRFRWTTPAPPTPTTPATTLVITSSVEQIENGKCVRWTGPAIGEGLRIDEGIHVWNFIKADGGVIVRTEESWTGDQIEADPETAIKYLAPGLDVWLTALKTEAESRCHHRH